MILFILNNFTPGFLPACPCAAVILSAPLDTPVEDVVVLVTLTHEEVTEEFTEVRVVGLVIKTKGTGVVEEDTKLIREPAAEKISWSRHLLLHDAVVFLLLSCSLQSLPGKSAT